MNTPSQKRPEKHELSQLVLYPPRGKGAIQLRHHHFTFTIGEVRSFLSAEDQSPGKHPFCIVLVKVKEESVKLELYQPGHRPDDKSTRLAKVSLTLKENPKWNVPHLVRSFNGSPEYLLLLLKEAPKLRLPHLEPGRKSETHERELHVKV